MDEYDSLGFYNGGLEAGASQRHKHLQVVPLPLAPEGPAVPVEPLLSAAVVDENGFGTIPGFPFLHAFAIFDRDLLSSPVKAAENSHELYGEILRSLGMEAPGREGLTRQSLPYCLLVTRDWMLLVPRSREHFGEISLNSLAFAGSLFVIKEEQLAHLRSLGPMKALASVALPKEINYAF
jgi:ATP adenylyltransferase